MSHYWFHAGLKLQAKEFRYITILKIILIFTFIFSKKFNFSLFISKH